MSTTLCIFNCQMKSVAALGTNFGEMFARLPPLFPLFSCCLLSFQFHWTASSFSYLISISGTSENCSLLLVVDGTMLKRSKSNDDVNARILECNAGKIPLG